MNSGSANDLAKGCFKDTKGEVVKKTSLTESTKFVEQKGNSVHFSHWALEAFGTTVKRTLLPGKIRRIQFGFFQQFLTFLFQLARFSLFFF